MACFVAAYLHGVQEKPATVGYIESGGAAWRAGMRTDDHITQIDRRENPFFDDIRPIVMSSRKDEQVPIEWDRRRRTGNEHINTTVSPIRDEGQRFPQTRHLAAVAAHAAVGQQAESEGDLPRHPGGGGRAEVRAGRPHHRDERSGQPAG